MLVCWEQAGRAATEAGLEKGLDFLALGGEPPPQSCVPLLPDGKDLDEVAEGVNFHPLCQG